MGEIYLGETSGAANFSKQVAIKCILPHLAKNADFVQKFIDEANLMVQLQHGSIVPVIELFEEEGLLYLVMEYVPGRDLKAVLRKMKSAKEFTPISVCIWVVQQLCDALGYAHEKCDASGQPLGIIHRDVTPSNILLGASGEVKLLDFGIAKARSRVHQSISGTLQGKFIYMSPEQADGRAIDQRSDLFSLGLILYELLTHVRPFEGEGETEILRNARECLVSPPSLHRPDLDPELDSLVMRALGKDPTDRYRSAFEFRKAASAYLAKQDIHASPNTLSNFLHETFPEGVVDTNVSEIQSVDDALLQQINALTPSFVGVARSTITKEETLTLLPQPSLPSPASSRETSAPTSVGEKSLQTSSLSPRAMLLGILLIGVLVAAASLFDTSPHSESNAQRADGRSPTTVDVDQLTAKSTTLTPERRGRFDFSFNGPESNEVQLTVDSAQHSVATSLPLNRTYLICANAKGFEQSCKRTVLEADRQPLVFSLQRKPTLSPVVVGLDDNYEFIVNDVVEESFPMQLTTGTAYRICARSPLASNSPSCIRLMAKSGHYTPSIRLERKTDKPNPPKAFTFAKNLATDKHQHIIISSIPTADVFVKDQRLGTTPFKASRTLWGRRIDLRAKGYVNTPFSIPNRPKKTYRVNLERPAYLTVRVSPPASTILVDGRRVGTGFLKRFPLAPGTRKIEAVFSTSNGQENRWGPKDIQVVAGQEKHLDQIIVRRTRSATP